MVRSINDDVACTATTSPLEWVINDPVYEVASGVSERRPDQEHVTIYPNRVLEDYLHSNFPTATGVTYDTGPWGYFEVLDGETNLLGSYLFLNCSVVAPGEITNEPVNGHCDPRQRIYLSRFSETAGNIEVTDD